MGGAQVELGRNDTVKVKVADAACLQYVKTYTPLFDCRSRPRASAPLFRRALLAALSPSSRRGWSSGWLMRVPGDSRVG